MTDIIRESLHYKTYIEHAKSIKSAADENNKLFYNIVKEELTEENRIKSLGLYRASLMLYAISIELLLKAIGLYKEKDNIESGNIKTFNEFINKWKSKESSGHDFMDLIDKYKIEFQKGELEVIKKLQDYTIWAGRFPFPRKEKRIKKLEKTNGQIGIPISLACIKTIDKIIKSGETLLKQ